MVPPAGRVKSLPVPVSIWLPALELPELLLKVAGLAAALIRVKIRPSLAAVPAEIPVIVWAEAPVKRIRAPARATLFWLPVVL